MNACRETRRTRDTRGTKLVTTLGLAKSAIVNCNLCMRFEVKLKRVSFSFAPLSIRGSNGAFGPLYMSKVGVMI